MNMGNSFRDRWTLDQQSLVCGLCHHILEQSWQITWNPGKLALDCKKKRLPALSGGNLCWKLTGLSNCRNTLLCKKGCGVGCPMHTRTRNQKVFCQEGQGSLWHFAHGKGFAQPMAIDPLDRIWVVKEKNIAKTLPFVRRQFSRTTIADWSFSRKLCVHRSVNIIFLCFSLNFSWIRFHPFRPLCLSLSHRKAPCRPFLCPRFWRSSSRRIWLVSSTCWLSPFLWLCRRPVCLGTCPGHRSCSRRPGRCCHGTLSPAWVSDPLCQTWKNPHHPACNKQEWRSVQMKSPVISCRCNRPDSPPGFRHPLQKRGRPKPDALEAPIVSGHSIPCLTPMKQDTC